MNDITKRWGFQRILHEAVRYRMLRDQYRVLRGSARDKSTDILDREFAAADAPARIGLFLDDLAFADRH